MAGRMRAAFEKSKEFAKKVVGKAKSGAKKLGLAESFEHEGKEKMRMTPRGKKAAKYGAAGAGVYGAYRYGKSKGSNKK